MHLRSLLLVGLTSLGSVAACRGGATSGTSTAAGSGAGSAAGSGAGSAAGSGAGSGAGSAAGSGAALAEPNSEAIGGLKSGARAPEVIALFGEPTSKTEPIVEEATGETVATWTWPAQGLEVRVSIVGAVTMVGGIRITAPSKLTTSRGVGIGATRASVESTYAAYRTIGRDPEEPDPSSEDQIVIGSLYGGTFFTFKDGKVTDIFVGAGAE